MLTAVKTPEDHRAALARIDALMEAEAGSPEAAELEMLAILVQRYEREAFPIYPPSPLDAIEFRMEQERQRLRDLLLEGAVSAPSMPADDAYFDRLRDGARQQNRGNGKMRERE